MASVKFDCKETPKKILELIDMNKHEMSELDYVYMCNFMKSKYTTVNSEKVVEPVRRRFQKDEKLLYNGRDGTMKWCTIVSFDSTTRSYIIKLQNCGTIRDTVAVRLYELDELIESTQVVEDNEVLLLGNEVKFDIPCSQKNTNKILNDIRYRTFMINETKYSNDDCIEVMKMSGLTISQNIITRCSIEQFIDFTAKYIKEDEFYILLDDVRNNRCKKSNEYNVIKEKYKEILGDNKKFKLAFD